jgi:hypothetical protein
MGFLGPAIGAGTAILGGFLGSQAANKAAQLQATGATQAGNLAQAAGQQAQGYQQQQLGAATAGMAPYTAAGAGATSQLSSLLQPGGYLASTWNQQFQAPTAEQAAATPGYQFTLQQGTQALNRGAAARGDLLSSGAAKQLEQYGTGLANQTYNDVYNRAMGQYQTNYQTFRNNQADLFNRLYGASEQGLAATSDLSRMRQAAAENYGRLGMTSAQWQGQDILNAAEARAQGVLGAAGAWRGALSNVGGAAMAMPNINFGGWGGGGGGGGGGTWANVNANPGGYFNLGGADLSGGGGMTALASMFGV